MATVDDVAAALIDRLGSMPAMKLQKLLYYCQAWHLVWDEEPMFEDRIEAWANGPVVRSAYRRHRGLFRVDQWNSGDGSRLTKSESETVDAVVDFYGEKTAQYLSELTHVEDPWRLARQRAHLTPGQRGTAEITPADMAEYYGSLIADS